MAITEKYVSVAGGGAHDGTSEANAYTWAEMITAINAAAGNSFRYNVKAGTYTLTTTVDSITVAATAANPIIIRGYSSTIGDANLGRTNTNGPLITTNMPAITYTTGYLDGSAATFVLFESLNITSAEVTNSKATLISGADCETQNCAIANTANNTNARGLRQAGAFSIIRDCDVSATANSSARGLVIVTTGTHKIIGCRITATNIGVDVANVGNWSLLQSTIFGCVTGVSHVTSTASGAQIYGCTIAGCTTGIGLASNQIRITIEGNLITDNTTGLDCGGTGSSVYLGTNRFDRNTTNIANGGDWVTATSYGHNTTSATQANEFQNYAGNDFRLLGGSPARANGIPAYRDIGALQHQDAGGMGSCYISIP